MLNIQSHDFTVDDSDPLINRSQLKLRNINATKFVGKYYCLAVGKPKKLNTFEVSIIPKYVTYIYVKGKKY